MSLQTILYLMILFAAAMISGFLAWYTWRHRQTVGAKSFSLLMLVLFQWGTAYILQLISTDLAYKSFWDNVTFLWNIQAEKHGLRVRESSYCLSYLSSQPLSFGQTIHTTFSGLPRKSTRLMISFFENLATGFGFGSMQPILML